MILFLLLLISLLAMTIVFYWITNRKLSKKIKDNHQKLANNEALLIDMMVSQEEVHQKIGQALHSSLVSKLYAIDLALYALKKTKEPTLLLQQTVGVITEATHTARVLIDELVQEVDPPVLDQLGLVPALQDLAANYAVDMKSTGTITTSAASSVERHLYSMVKDWMKQSILDHQANQICIDWQKSGEQWSFTYTDNGIYGSHFRRNSYLVSARLSLLQAQIQYSKTPTIGRVVRVWK